MILYSDLCELCNTYFASSDHTIKQPPLLMMYIYIHIYSNTYLSTIHDKGVAIKLTFYCEKLHIISYLISRERSLFFGWKRFLDKTPVYLPGLWIQRRMSATGAEDRFWFFCELAGKQATLPNAPKLKSTGEEVKMSSEIWQECPHSEGL